MSRLAAIGSSRFTSHGLLYLVGEAGSKGLAFLVLILLARWTSPAAFGTLNVYVAVVGLMGTVVGFGLPNSILRFYFKQENFPAVVGTALALILMSAGSVGLLSWMLGREVAKLFSIPVTLLWLSVPGALAIAVRNAWLSSLRARRRSATYSVSQLCEPLIFILAVALYLIYSRSTDVLPLLVFFSGATMLVAIGACFRWFTDPGLIFDRALILPLVMFSLPLMLHGFAMLGINTAAQLVINQLQGEAATGMFAFAYRFGMAMLIISTAFSATWMPEFLDRVRTPEGRTRLDAMAQGYMNGMMLIAVVLMAILPIAARWLGGDAYHEVLPLIPVVVYGYLWFIAYTLVVGYSIHEERTLVVAVATGVTMLLNVVANYLAVPAFGLSGAAWVAVASYALLFAGQLWAARRYAADIRFRWIIGKATLMLPVTLVIQYLIGG